MKSTWRGVPALLKDVAILAALFAMLVAVSGCKKEAPPAPAPAPAPVVVAPEKPAAPAGPIPRAADRYKRDLVRHAKRIWGIDAPVASFAAQLHQESGWNPDAVSPAGAQGLAQFMPATAKWMAEKHPEELGEYNPKNPMWAIQAQLRYMYFLHGRIPAANGCERMAYAMGCYNGGEGWMRKRIAKSAEPLVCFDATCAINPGITASNQRENDHYPKRILRELEARYVAAGWGRGSCS